MKVFLFALFVAAAVAVPLPLDEETGEPVEFIVNGIVEGEPLELGDVLDIKVKEHANGEVVSATNLLHPLTAVGLAEAAAAAIAAEDTVDVPLFPEIPESVILPAPVLPGLSVPAPNLPEISLPVIPESVVLPESIIPELPEPIVLPEPAAPEVVPQPIVLPEPAAPEVVPEQVIIPAPVPELPAEVIPIPAPQGPNGEVFNDGIVQVTVNGPEPGVLSTVQSWFNMVLNYFNGDVQTTHQIV